MLALGDLTHCRDPICLPGAFSGARRDRQAWVEDWLGWPGPVGMWTASPEVVGGVEGASGGPAMAFWGLLPTPGISHAPSHPLPPM